ncbi:MAG: hypothetical protein PHN19_04350 [Patescibacteria group bacterium]|nr:hypothetical protein [Patescibacteria group bacterium]
MSKKTLTTTKSSTKIVNITAIATSVLVLAAILAGFSYGMFIKYKGEKKYEAGYKFFTTYIK